MAELKHISTNGALLKAHLFLLISILGVLICGCATSTQLKFQTTSCGRTLTDLQYKMVLDNVAMFCTSQNALPSHSQITGGVIQVTDSFGAGSPNLSYSWSPWSWAMGFSVTRKFQESWTIVPVTDLEHLQKLQAIYAVAAKQPWIQHGDHVPSKGVITGNFGHTWVWVKDTDRANLTDLTLEVMAAVPPNVKHTVGGPSYLIQ